MPLVVYRPTRAVSVSIAHSALFSRSTVAVPERWEASLARTRLFQSGNLLQGSYPETKMRMPPVALPQSHNLLLPSLMNPPGNCQGISPH